VLFLIGLFYLLPRYFECLCFRHSSVQERMRSKMKFWKLFLYGLFLIYPAVSSTIFRHFVCKKIDDRAFLYSDLRVECYTQTWTLFCYFSIPLILIYPVGIPLFFFSLLKLNRSSLHENRIKAQLGFLYAGYRAEAWWWEIADCLHKLALSSLIAFFPPDAQLPIGLAVAGVFTIAVFVMNPFLRNEDDVLQLLAQTEIILLLLAALVFSHIPSASYSKKDDIVMSVALGFVIILFLVVFLWKAGKEIQSAYAKWSEKRKIRKEKEAKRLAKQEAAAAAAAAAANGDDGGHGDEDDEENGAAPVPIQQDYQTPDDHDNNNNQTDDEPMNSPPQGSENQSSVEEDSENDEDDDEDDESGSGSGSDEGSDDDDDDDEGDDESASSGQHTAEASENEGPQKEPTPAPTPKRATRLPPLSNARK